MLKPGTPERESPVRFNIQHWLQILAGFIAYVKAIKVTHGNEASYYYYNYLPERESPASLIVLIVRIFCVD